MRIIAILAFAVLNLAAAAGLNAVTVDLKNILIIEGLQDNPLLGYGIVVGLKGTGDSETGSQTREILSRIANNFGFNISQEKLKPKNSAVVLVSGIVSAFSQVGSRIDIKVSSIFDAKSLEGGELIITPLLGGDNSIYAIAQGGVVIDRNSKGVVGYITLGGIIQKQIEHIIVNTNRQFAVSVQESLGFNAVNRVVESIKSRFPDAVLGVNNNRITMAIPPDRDFLQFISDIFQLKADVDEEPGIIIDSKSGILVSGGNIIITEAAISFKGTRLTVGVQTAGWGGSSGTNGSSEDTVRLYRTTTTVSELVEGLNQIGASSSDIIKILQLLYKNGNLKSRLIVQ